MNPQKTIYITSSDMRQLRDLLLNPAPTHNKAHLEQLEDELNRAEVVEPQQIPSNIVTMNSTVHLIEMGTRDEMIVTLVYPDQANIAEGKISVLAPVGMAILGSTMGSRVKWEVPDGIGTFKIDRILYQPEAAGEYSR